MITLVSIDGLPMNEVPKHQDTDYSALADEELAEKVREVINTLGSPLEREIVRLKYGIDSSDGEMNFQQIAEKLNLRESWVKSKYNDAMRKLQHPSRAGILGRTYLGRKRFFEWRRESLKKK